MPVALYYRPDKMFLNEQLDLMRKSFIYSSKCITYKMSKEEKVIFRGINLCQKLRNIQAKNY